MKGSLVVRVAIDAPLRRAFDYLPPLTGPAPVRGARIQVPFARRHRIGLILETGAASDLPTSRLRRADLVLDQEPVISGPLLELLTWAADYYGCPVGEVCAAALPGLLRKGRPAHDEQRSLALTRRGLEADVASLTRRAPRQAEILTLLAGGPVAERDPRLTDLASGWRDVVRRLETKGIVNWTAISATPAASASVRPVAGPVLSTAQADAVDRICRGLGAFQPYLLYGVTGSGKTEVYLSAIERVARGDRQTLVIVPEIGLTPQLVERFRRRFGCPIAVLHSGLSNTERLDAWRLARDAGAPIVIGTRSAVFAPLPDCGLIVVDEEHDPSLKQQEGFRYSARDLAVMRARLQDVPVVLGSATPSLETLQNAADGRYVRLDLPERAGASTHPSMRVVDLRIHPARDGLTTPLRDAMTRHLAQDGQVMLFLNRRGYAPVLFCTECGWIAGCQRCDARLTLHRGPARLLCHHCGWQSIPPTECASCGTTLKAVGQGTERIEETLTQYFPQAAVARIDRDTTRGRGDLQRILEEMRSGTTRILIGTQMLTKGHDFPDVTLVGILNADQGLFGTDFRSDERLAQSILQVAGRAGRRQRSGEVLIQTAYPEHPLLTRLIQGGYDAFATAALEERRLAVWPPFSYLALIRAEAHGQQAPSAFLADCRAQVEQLGHVGVTINGPAPAPMERRAGRYRAQLLFHSTRRSSLHNLLGRMLPAIESLPAARKVRWSLDVDPAELF